MAVDRSIADGKYVTRLSRATAYNLLRRIRFVFGAITPPDVRFPNGSRRRVARPADRAALITEIARFGIPSANDEGGGASVGHVVGASLGN